MRLSTLEKYLHMVKMFEMAEKFSTRKVAMITMGEEEEDLFKFIGDRTFKQATIDLHTRDNCDNPELATSFISIFDDDNNRIITTLRVLEDWTMLLYTDYCEEEETIPLRIRKED